MSALTKPETKERVWIPKDWLPCHWFNSEPEHQLTQDAGSQGTLNRLLQKKKKRLSTPGYLVSSTKLCLASLRQTYSRRHSAGFCGSVLRRSLDFCPLHSAGEIADAVFSSLQACSYHSPLRLPVMKVAAPLEHLLLGTSWEVMAFFQGKKTVQLPASTTETEREKKKKTADMETALFLLYSGFFVVFSAKVKELPQEMGYSPNLLTMAPFLLKVA